MRHRPGPGLATIGLTIASTLLSRGALAASDTYSFRDTLASAEAGNVLQPVFNGAGTPSPTFVDTVVDVNACANTPTVRGYAFPKFGGLKSTNDNPVVAGGSYTITMIVKFSPLQGGYTRLIDFSNSTLDEGIYVLNRGISFYPVGNYAPESFATDRFSVMTLTRDAATDKVSLFIGRTAAGSYVDSTNPKRYAAAAAKNLIFFMDNTTGSAAVSESSAGVVTFLRVTDTPITADDLGRTIDEACQAVACGNGRIEGSEGCDDGNNVDGDGCTSTCKLENGQACRVLDGGAGPVDAGDAGDAGDAAAAGDAGPPSTGASSCASGVCDTRDQRCGYANGVGSDCASGNAVLVCRSGLCDTSTFTCFAGAVDASAPDDAAVPADAALPVDAGATAPADAAVSRADASTPFDAGLGDAGTPVTPEPPPEDDCDCTVGPGSAPDRLGASLALVGGFAGLFFVRRARRRRSRS